MSAIAARRSTERAGGGQGRHVPLGSPRRRGARVLAALALCALSAAASAIDPWSSPPAADASPGEAAYLRAGAFTGNTVVPVRLLLHPSLWGVDYGPAQGENIAVATARIESGVARDGWRIGVVGREDWFATANRAALDLYEQSQSGVIALGRPQQASYEVRGWSGGGLQLGRDVRLPFAPQSWTVDAGATLNLLEGQHLRREDWSGSFVPLGGGIVLADGGVTRDDDILHHNLFGGPVPPLEGHPGAQGFSLDFSISVSHPGGIHFDWTIADAWSLMQWRNIHSERFAADEFIVCQQLTPACAKAMLSYTDLAAGVVVSRSLDVRINSKQSFGAAVPVEGVGVLVRDAFGYGVHFPSLGLRYPADGNRFAGVEYDVRFRSAGIFGRYRMLSAGIQTDATSIGRARVLAATLGMGVSF